jgi:hypothetical protein
LYILNLGLLPLLRRKASRDPALVTGDVDVELI